MRLAGVILAFVIAISGTAQGKLSDEYKRSVGILSFGRYEPLRATRWEEIPQTVREHIQAHLLQRLGQDQYTKLSFVRAQIVDFDRLKVHEPNSANYKWEIPAYRIVVATSFPNAGIRIYEAEILARPDGSLIREIDLSCLACEGKANVLSVSEAARIAESRGFSLDLLNASVGYSEEAGSIYWEFRQVSKRSKYGVEYRAIQIDAHSGDVLHIGPGEYVF